MKHKVKQNMALNTSRDSFLIVGGYGDSDYSTILEYDPKTEGWITWEEKLKEARHQVAAMMVDSTLFPQCA
jgi:hypothetical protein